MKQGRGKQKGSSFERLICKELSLMVTNGKRKDCFWRSAMSGGRATVHKLGDVRQAGDICAVAPEGNALVEQFYFECKFYRNLAIGRFVIENKGPLGRFWTKTVAEARKHNRIPVLIAKQNNLPIFVVWQNRQIVSFKRWLKAKAGIAVRR
jgi:hypothetical protein